MIDLTNTMGKHLNVTYPVPAEEKMYRGPLGHIRAESFWNSQDVLLLDEVELDEDGEWVDVDG